jgi:hypothetical protein
MAAHAVIAALSGWVVARITIAPSRAERQQSLLGEADVRWPRWDMPCPVPLSPTAEFDVNAAGLAWDGLRDNAHWGWDWEWCASQDRLNFAESVFNSPASRLQRALSWLKPVSAESELAAAIARVQQTFERAEVAVAVREIAEAVQRTKGGEIFTTKIETIIARHVPQYRAGRKATAQDLAAWYATTPRDPSLPPVKWTPPQRGITRAEQTPSPAAAREIKRSTHITIGGFSMPIDVAAPLQSPNEITTDHTTPSAAPDHTTSEES